MSQPKPHLVAILELHASSAALKNAHAALLEAGHAEIAALVHAAALNVMKAIGRVVVAHSKASQAAAEVTS